MVWSSYCSYWGFSPAGTLQVREEILLASFSFVSKIFPIQCAFTSGHVRAWQRHLCCGDWALSSIVTLITAGETIKLVEYTVLSAVLKFKIRAKAQRGIGPLSHFTFVCVDLSYVTWFACHLVYVYHRSEKSFGARAI